MPVTSHSRNSPSLRATFPHQTGNSLGQETQPRHSHECNGSQRTPVCILQVRIGKFEAKRGEITQPRSVNQPHEQRHPPQKPCVLLCLNLSALLYPQKKLSPGGNMIKSGKGRSQTSWLGAGSIHSPGTAVHVCLCEKAPRGLPWGKPLIFAEMNPLNRNVCLMCPVALGISRKYF